MATASIKGQSVAGFLLRSLTRQSAVHCLSLANSVDGYGFIYYRITAGLATLIVFWFVGYIFSPWARAFFSGAPVPLTAITGMRLRRSPAMLLVDAYVRLNKRSKNVTLSDVETHLITSRDRIHSAEDLVDVVLKEM